MWHKYAILSLLFLIFSLCLFGLGAWYQSISPKPPERQPSAVERRHRMELDPVETGDKSSLDSSVMRILRLLVTISLILFAVTFFGEYFYDHRT